MDILRCSGGSVRAFDDTSRSPTWISPAEGSRKPAISRNVVVLPQPDGPSRQTSCPWSIFKETLSTTASGPNRLVRPRKSTDANRSLPRFRSCTDQRPAWYASIRTNARWERELSWKAKCRSRVISHGERGGPQDGRNEAFRQAINRSRPCVRSDDMRKDLSPRRPGLRRDDHNDLTPRHSRRDI